jgi:thiol-disulfide isomerase/thioredoxin
VIRVVRARCAVTVISAGLLLAGALGAGAQKPYPAPALPAQSWLNTHKNRPLRLEELRGKVVLIEFWTFACVNCRNTLPYVKAWHEKYSPQGLVVIGVHTPEFDFERKPEKVRQAVEELGIRYPVALDNDYATWRRYKNQYWPAIYLIDAQGQVVYVTIGEGNYDRTEARIQELLRQAGNQKSD